MIFDQGVASEDNNTKASALLFYQHLNQYGTVDKISSRAQSDFAVREQLEANVEAH